MQALRGRTTQVMGFDEADFISETAIENGALPQFSVDQSVIFMWSSAKLGGGFVSKQIRKKKDDASYPVSTMYVGGACKHCEETSHGMKKECTHNIYKPRFFNAEYREFQRKLMSTHSYLREVINYVVEKCPKYFGDRSIAQISALPVLDKPLVAPMEGGWFVVGIDTGCSDSRNETVMIAVSRINRTHLVLLSAVVIRVRQDSEAVVLIGEGLLTLLERAFANCGNKRALAIVAVESNFGFSAPLVAHHVQRWRSMYPVSFPYRVAMYHDPMNSAQFSIAGKSASLIAESTQIRGRALTLDEMQVRPAVGFVQTARKREDALAEICVLLNDGLLFRSAQFEADMSAKLIYESANIRRDENGHWSGKIDHMGRVVARQNDDMFMALCIAAYASKVLSQGFMRNLLAFSHLQSVPLRYVLPTDHAEPK